MAKSSHSIYQIKVSLIDAKPPIWRRLLVSSTTTLAKLHDILQIAMGWENYHLHQFEANGISYGRPDPDFDWDDIIDERQVKLHDVLRNEKDSLRYEYDFGDSWEHKIVLEKIFPRDGKIPVPQCIKGKRACPPEDVGGVWGYESFLEAISDPKHPEHKDMLEWVGGDFDPEEFYLDAVNELLTMQN